MKIVLSGWNKLHIHIHALSTLKKTAFFSMSHITVWRFSLERYDEVLNLGSNAELFNRVDWMSGSVYLKIEIVSSIWNQKLITHIYEKCEMACMMYN